MKRTPFILLCLAVFFLFSACGNKATQQNSEVTDEVNAILQASAEVNNTNNGPSNKSKSLVVYFSMPETENADNMTEDEENSVVIIDGQVLGNTQYVATLIQEQAGAELFRIEPKTPYPTDHEMLVNMAQEEQTNNARPELKNNIENLESYDRIFIGYPIWWSDFPMIMYTFFDENDFSGKEIIPFNTHGGSGLAGTVETIKELEPQANVTDLAFSVSRDNVQDCKDDLVNWLKELDY